MLAILIKKGIVDSQNANSSLHFWQLKKNESGTCEGVKSKLEAVVLLETGLPV
jgi:hypothetical protein